MTTASTYAWGSAIVDVRESAGRRLLEDLSMQERRDSTGARGWEGYAGKVAAKRAVLSAAGADAHYVVAVDVMPDRSRCPEAGPCDRGHPPVAEITTRSGSPVRLSCVSLSISHTRDIACAVAVIERQPTPCT